jgi:hypothetical protein
MFDDSSWLPIIHDYTTQRWMCMLKRFCCVSTRVPGFWTMPISWYALCKVVDWLLHRLIFGHAWRTIYSLYMSILSASFTCKMEPRKPIDWIILGFDYKSLSIPGSKSYALHFGVPGLAPTAAYIYIHICIYVHIWEKNKFCIWIIYIIFQLWQSIAMWRH